MTTVTKFAKKNASFLSHMSQSGAETEKKVKGRGWEKNSFDKIISSIFFSLFKEVYSVFNRDAWYVDFAIIFSEVRGNKTIFHHFYVQLFITIKGDMSLL